MVPEFMPFFIIFVIIPLAEISVFMAVGEHIGLGMTLLLSLLTAILGGALVKYQGMHTITEIQKAAARGQMPLGKLFDGACLIAAGATLITPGFVTDTIGFLLLLPPVRAALKAAIKKHMNIQTTESDIIEGEFEALDDSENNRS